MLDNDSTFIYSISALQLYDVNGGIIFAMEFSPESFILRKTSSSRTTAAAAAAAAIVIVSAMSDICNIVHANKLLLCYCTLQ